MTSLARRERTALADLMAELGPAAPTLCGRWTTRDLAAHLVVRESSPSAVGIAVPQLSGWTRNRQTATAGKDFGRLVDQVRHGPPLWSPMRVGAVDDAVNTFEFFVHHEDVRRAQDAWQSRELTEADDGTLWAALRSRAAFYLRRVPLGVRLHTPDGREHEARGGDLSVTLTGAPGELVLYVHGRRDHSVVEVSGEPAALEAFRQARLKV